jgi:hypothetical protein
VVLSAAGGSPVTEALEKISARQLGIGVSIHAGHLGKRHDNSTEAKKGPDVGPD